MKTYMLFSALLLSISIYACPSPNDVPAKPKHTHTSSTSSPPQNVQPTSPYAKLAEYNKINSQDGEYKVSKGKTVLGKIDVANNAIDKTLTVADTLEQIVSDAFYDQELTNLVLSSKVKRIQGWAFWSNHFKEVTFPESLSSIGVKAFEFNKIEILTFPDSIKYIGDAAFYGNNLQKITLPNSIDKKVRIGTKAFAQNENLTEVSLAATLYDLFKSKKELESKFGTNVTTYTDLDGNILPEK